MGDVMTTINDLSIEGLREDLEHQQQRYCELETRYTRMQQEQVRAERDAEAAMRRRIWDEVLTRVDFESRGALARQVGELAWLFGNPRLTPKDYAMALGGLSGVIRAWKPTEEVAELAELRRIRGAVEAAGRRLHGLLMPLDEATGERCGCAGCELIREVYAGPVTT